MFGDISAGLEPRERVGVFERFVGVVARLAGLKDLFSVLCSLKLDPRPDGEAARELTRVDAALDSEEPLNRFEMGIREVEEDSWGVIGVATVVLNVGLTPFMVLTLLSGMSLWFRLWPSEERGVTFFAASSKVAAPRYQAVVGEGASKSSSSLARS